MSQVIAFAGKGGTGKTTIAALFINHLIKNGKKPVLVVDADPNYNLGEALGVKVEKSIGLAREEFFGARASIPAGMPKDAYIDIKLNETLIESRDFDLMVMGRQEGEGCYCYLNNILRRFIEQTTNNYPVTVIDNEAGMEHLARRTSHHIDNLIIASDYSVKGLRAAHRILELIKELSLTVKDKHLIVTRAPAEVPSEFSKRIEDLNVDFLGYIPDDEEILSYDLQQKSLFELPAENPALKAVAGMMERIIQ